MTLRPISGKTGRPDAHGRRDSRERHRPGLEACRGYIQHWLDGREIPERNAQRIFKAADAILRAGRAVVEAEPVESDLRAA